jgi:hypothetical protein
MSGPYQKPALKSKEEEAACGRPLEEEETIIELTAINLPNVNSA